VGQPGVPGPRGLRGGDWKSWASRRTRTTGRARRDWKSWASRTPRAGYKCVRSHVAVLTDHLLRWSSALQRQDRQAQ
jgi:hypothetical protein